jgi:hypothetical protein
MNQINKKLKPKIILILSIPLFFIIYYLFFSKIKEGYSIDQAIDSVNDVKNDIKNIPNEIKGVEQRLTEFLTKKLTSIFVDLGNMFKNGIIDPMLSLFNGIGNIFVQLFDIFKQIGSKIGSLPSCISTYMMKQSIDTMYLIYNKIVPDFFKNINSTVYDYTLKYIFEFIGYITGYSDSVDKCYNFNISTNVDKMSDSLKDINSSFKKDFGKLDFSKIKI